jgi:hypothetical protein
VQFWRGSAKWGLVKGKKMNAYENAWAEAEKAEQDRRENRIWRRAGRLANSAVLKVREKVSAGGK